MSQPGDQIETICTMNPSLMLPCESLNNILPAREMSEDISDDLLVCQLDEQ